MIRLADFVIDFLSSKKIKKVFTVSGGGSIFLCDALYKSKKIDYISHHHEQAASFAAEGYARSLNSPGCCLVTTGPGGTNALTGASCAWIDSVPMIFISGQVFFNQTIKNTKKRQIGVQEIDIISLAKPVTKYAKLIRDPSHIKYELEKAHHLATSGRPGPVWIDIPADVQNTNIVPDKLKKYHPPFKKKISKKNIKKIKKIAAKLNISRAPVILLGGGAKLSGIKNLLQKFINKYQIPILLTWNADELLDNTNKFYFGKPGAFGQRGANFIIQNADFFLSVGSRLPYMVTGYNVKDFAKNANFKAMVDIDKNELKKNDLNLDEIVCEDAKIFLENISKYLKKNKRTKWINYCKEMKSKYPSLINKMINESKFVNSYYFVNELSKKLKKKDHLITDMGFSFTTTHQAFLTKLGQKFYTNSGHAPMGWGLPAAIGSFFSESKKEIKKKNVVCLTGEGGLEMNIQELATVMHHKIPIKLFIFNNGGYLTIKQTQILGFNSRIMGANKKSGLSFPNYNFLAKAHQIKYSKIFNHKNLDKKIEKILESKSPVICELIMNPDEEQLPKAINKRDENGKSIPTNFEDMYPFLPRNEINSNSFK